MNTIYNTNIDNKLLSDYLSYIINKVYALLPLFEESMDSNDKKKSFNNYQKTLIQKINGNTELMMYDSILIIDILSQLQALFNVKTHDEYKRHIMKTCKLLTLLKKEVDTSGL